MDNENCEGERQSNLKEFGFPIELFKEEEEGEN